MHCIGPLMVWLHNMAWELFWMNSHSLKLNNEKTEFVLFGSKVNLSKIDINSIVIPDTVIGVSDSCRNLGVMLDSIMSMSSQISSICKSVWYQLRNLGFIRKYLTRSAAEKIVNALISYRLDFGNALLYNLPQTKLAKIQRLQNAAARIVTLTRKYTHITPILKSLHWLPIEQHIKFKILLSVFHCVQGSAPQYNLSLINVYRVAQNNGTVDTVDFSGLCSNQQLFSSACWIEHLLPIIITPRSSNLVENFLFYETFLMDCHFRDLPDFQSFEARWQINGKSPKWQSIRNYS